MAWSGFVNVNTNHAIVKLTTDSQQVMDPVKVARDISASDSEDAAVSISLPVNNRQ